jgi:hypothetical protein
VGAFAPAFVAALVAESVEVLPWLLRVETHMLNGGDEAKMSGVG